MASLQHTLLTPSRVCCCSSVLLHSRTRKISPTPRFPNGAFSMAQPFLQRDFSEGGGTLASKMVGRRRLGVTGAGKGPFFGGGRRPRSTARTVGNLAFVALLAYLAVSGQFRWLLDAIVSLWLIAFFLPIVGLGALVFFARRNILQNNCPNCGKSFRVLKTSLKNGPQFCPYCTQPFSVQDDKFVRESASFSSGRASPSAQAFNELFNRGSQEKAPTGSGTIVDVEAEVTDIE